MRVLKPLIFMLLVVSSWSFGRKPDQLREGFLALPSSQQPSNLFSTGGNIVDAHDLKAVLLPLYTRGKDKKLVEIVPGILYGVSDNFSIFLNVPFAAKNKIATKSSAGIEDIFVQAEYAFFNKDEYAYSLQNAIIGALYLPTGSTKKNPVTGTGSPAFLLGNILSYTSVDWYWFISPIAFLTTSHHGTQFGNQFLYQGGLGRCIFSKSDRVMIGLILDLFGIVSQRDTIHRVIDKNSGGHVCYLGPTLWTSTQRFSGQIGVMYAVAQHLHGCQNKDRYVFGVDLRWKFNG
jgi:hypothetical protein